MTIAISTVDPSVIGTYSDLLEMIPLWLDRDDLDDQITRFISLIEPSLNRRLRTLNQEVRATWVVSSESMALPADFRMIRVLKVGGEHGRELRNVSPNNAAIEYTDAKGFITGYYVSNRTLILVPPPEEETTLSAIYYTRLASLTLSDQTNWLLQEHPDVYVWGALQQAAIFIRDPEAISACGDLYEQAVSEVIQASRRDKWGGAPITPNIINQVGRVRC